MSTKTINVSRRRFQLSSDPPFQNLHSCQLLVLAPILYCLMHSLANAHLVNLPEIMVPFDTLAYAAK